MDDKVSDYSRLDRLLHRLAFSKPIVQRALAELEDSLFGSEIDSTGGRDPIFVTSLPRAGTTVLLTALADLPGLACHTYRDMPFVMAPQLWARISGAFQKEGSMKERAHGDGVKVGYDSPEAFEEVLWRSFWPDKYHEDRIDLWEEADADAEATEFFRKHFAKIVMLRCPNAREAGRYISKNNGNIARLDVIPALFPDANIVLPIRTPMEHAASLYRQHLNFLKQHETDAFTKRYMHDIGHLEFGDLHRPISFPAMTATGEHLLPTTLDYWLHYWIAAFEYVAERRDQVIIVPHEKVCNDSEVTIAQLFDKLGISNTEMLSQVSSHFDPKSARTHSYAKHSRVLRDQAEAMYASLSSN